MTQQCITLPDTELLASTLYEYRITIAVTSKAEGLLYLLSAGPAGCICTRYRASSPMGISFQDGKLAVGSSMGIQTFRNTSASRAHATFAPLSTHHTGAVSVHEVSWTDGALYFANTLFSSICRIDPGCSFTQVWQPPFVFDVAPLDACHLNGMVADAAGDHIATVLALTGTPSGWRTLPPGNGALIHARDGVLVDGLDLPHSPVRQEENIYFLESGKSCLWCYDTVHKVSRRIFHGRGVFRGLALQRGIAVIGVSQIRADSPSSHSFGRLLDVEAAGVLLVDMHSGEQLCHALLPSVKEISSLAILPFERVSMLNTWDPRLLHTYHVRTHEGMLTLE
ncbi:DUF4915 domain-containing protein [Xanthomonas oryzae]|uniref:DUF4915 domain-containing protein n=1 Tax=Xanthomonas oryzae TaxID=347 RepID=UPI003D185E82